MRNILAQLCRDGDGCPLGKTLFETYPAATLELCGKPRKPYKGCCVYKEGRWSADDARKKKDEDEEAKQKRKDNGDTLAGILNDLKWVAADNFQMDHNDFDAVVCALTGLRPADQLKGPALDEAINSRIMELDAKRCGLARQMAFAAPRGYVLLKKMPEQVWADEYLDF